MVQNAAEGKKDVRNVNAGKSCSNTGLRIVGHSNKLAYLTSQSTAHSSTKPHYIFHCSPLTDKTRALIQVHPELPELLLRIKQHCCEDLGHG